MPRIETTLGHWATLITVSLCAMAGCKEPAPTRTLLDSGRTDMSEPSINKEATIPSPMLPFEGGTHKPSLATLVEGQPFDAKGFAQQAECGACHGEIQTEWSQSMHAFASLSNDIYLASFKRFMDERGETHTKFCAGCHDPALMFDDSVALSVDTAPAQAHQGIACQSCHGVQEATTQGNASYTLSTAPIPAPIDGDDASLIAHRKAASPIVLRSNELCASCHRGTLTPEMGHDIVLAGLDELGPWRRSAWNHNQTWRIDHDDLPKQDCVGCHMPRVDGHASHRFAGGHSTFAAMIDAPDQLDAIKTQLKGAATLDMFALSDIPAHARREDVRTVGMDVVIFNERVGHAFPGGAKDLRDTWVEIVVTDERGEVIASSGLQHEQTAREDYTYVLHARLASGDGDRQTDHDVSHFRTPIYDHTIKPRDAAVVRYVFDVKGKEARRLQVRTRLRHRRLTPDILAEACAFSKTDQGAEYKAHTLTHTGKRPDPCIVQPIIEVSEVSMALLVKEDGSFEVTELSAPLPEWQRYYRYGLGLLHHVQENLEETRRAFEHAQKHVPEQQERARSMVIQGLGMVSARQGRTKEALALFARSDALVPDHPSNAYNIGEAYMRVWKFEEAAEAFETASKSGEDARILRRWAIALGSKSHHAEALGVAHRGLKSEPRDPDLLRSQMLAYRGLEGAPEAAKTSTADVYDVYKRDTKAPHVRDQCSRADPVCRAERTPIGIRRLRQQ